MIVSLLVPWNLSYEICLITRGNISQRKCVCSCRKNRTNQGTDRTVGLWGFNPLYSVAGRCAIAAKNSLVLADYKLYCCLHIHDYEERHELIGMQFFADQTTLFGTLKYRHDHFTHTCRGQCHKLSKLTYLGPLISPYWLHKFHLLWKTKL